jgi:hypothetical protein
MTDPILVFAEDDADERRRLVVNFGMFAGRHATPAEIERLGESLLRRGEPVDVVCEERYRFDSERSASVYQVRIELPRSAADSTDDLAAVVEDWARECLAERRLITP